jgi:hypothetical protein
MHQTHYETIRIENEYRCKQSKHISTVYSHIHNRTPYVHIRIAVSNQVPQMGCTKVNYSPTKGQSHKIHLWMLIAETLRTGGRRRNNHKMLSAAPVPWWRSERWAGPQGQQRMRGSGHADGGNPSRSCSGDTQVMHRTPVRHPCVDVSITASLLWPPGSPPCLDHHCLLLHATT